MSDPLKQEVERRNKYGVMESSKPHPPAKVEISRGTVLQLLREATDYRQKMWGAIRGIRKETGMASLGIRIEEGLLVPELNRLLDKLPTEITEEDVETFCKLADEAREGR